MQHSRRPAPRPSEKVNVLRYNGLPGISGIVLDRCRSGDMILSETRSVHGKYLGLVYVKSTSVRRVDIVE